MVQRIVEFGGTGSIVPIVDEVTIVRTGASDFPAVLVGSATYTVLEDDYYIGVNYNGQVTITLPSTARTGKQLIIKDESGMADVNTIILVGTIDDDTGGAILGIKRGALQLIYSGGWRII